MTTDPPPPGPPFVERLVASLDGAAASQSSAEPTAGDPPVADDARPLHVEGAGQEPGEDYAALLAGVSAVLSSAEVWSEPPDLRSEVLARVRVLASDPVHRPDATATEPDAGEPDATAAEDDSPAPGRADVAPVMTLRPRRTWRRLAVAVPVAAAAAVVVTLLVLGVQTALRPSPDATFTALGAAGVSAEVAVTSKPSGFEITLDPKNLPAAPRGSYYAAWVRRGPGPADVVPVGTFHGRRLGGPIVMWSGVDPAVYRTFSVTLQREDEPALPSAPSARRVLAATINR